jgi:fibronectin-binding autotransporter adhesin
MTAGRSTLRLECYNEIEVQAGFAREDRIMATIYWGSGVSGTFSTASDWAGGVVPGAGDTAVINAASTSQYTVSVTSATTVGGLILDQSEAVLAIDSSFTAASISLEAGDLQLNQGTLSGSVVQTGGSVYLSAGNTTFDNVTWAGDLDPIFPKVKGHHPMPGTLTFSVGLTLTGVNGTGKGKATFGGNIVLNDMTTLNNATIKCATGSTETVATITNSPTLTFGSHLNFTGQLSLGSGETLTNHGIVTSTGISGGTIVNDGTFNAGAGLIDLFNPASFTNNGTVTATGYTVFYGAFVNNGLIADGIGIGGSFTNNGTIDVASGQSLVVDYANLNAPGSAGRIDLNSGTLSVLGTFTTAQLIAVPGAQHVVATGSYGTNLGGTLNNADATLNFGAGTALGILNSTGLAFDNNPLIATINGGTIVDHGGNGPLGAFNLENLSFQSSDSTLSMYQVTMDNVMLSGATTLDYLSGRTNDQTLSGGTLSGVSTINDYTYLTLDGVDITGAGGSGAVTVNLANGGDLEVTDAQSLAGYSIDVSGSASQAGLLTAGSGSSVTLSAGASVNVAAGDGLSIADGSGGSWLNDTTISAAGTVTIGAYAATSFTNDGSIAISTGGELNIASLGTLINNGAITISGGTLELVPGNLTQDGSVSLTDGSTLALAGALTVASLSAIDAYPGSQEIVVGTLDLGGQTVIDGGGGVPAFGLGGGAQVNDGTLSITSATPLTVTGTEVGINTALNNQGDISFVTAEGRNAINGAITGTGSISLGGSGSSLFLDASVAAGQTIAFAGPNDLLGLSSSAVPGFDGTIAGYSVGDQIFLGGQSVASAEFVGSSIVATLSNSTTLSLHTSSALTGSISVSDAGGGGGTLTYASNAASVHDWSASNLASWHGVMSIPLREDGAMPRPDMAALVEWFMPVHML